MTLGNMRPTEFNVDAHPDDVPVPSFGPRMRCSKCGKLGATAIPNWKERADYIGDQVDGQSGEAVTQLCCYRKAFHSSSAITTMMPTKMSNSVRVSGSISIIAGPSAYSPREGTNRRRLGRFRPTPY
jgi:hypothetical protein